MTLKEKLIELFGLGPECFDSHETDLYILPPDDLFQNVLGTIRALGHHPVQAYSDVGGQDWHGKTFIDVPFAYTEHYNKGVMT